MKKGVILISVFVIILVIFFNFKDEIIKINHNSSLENNVNETEIVEDFYDPNKFIDNFNVKEKLETTPSYYKSSSYKKISETEKQKRVQDFILLNGKDWTVDLNEYGFIKNIETTNKDLIKKMHLDKSTEDFLRDHNQYKQTFAFEIANNYKDFLYKNKDFFGLNSNTEINITGKNIFSKNGVFISSGLKAETNINILEYNKEEDNFINKDITIIPSDAKLTITGHLWPGVLDIQPVFSYEEMAKKLDGYYGESPAVYYPCTPSIDDPRPCPYDPPYKFYFLNDNNRKENLATKVYEEVITDRKTGKVERRLTNDIFYYEFIDLETGNVELKLGRIFNLNGLQLLFDAVTNDIVFARIRK